MNPVLRQVLVGTVAAVLGALIVAWIQEQRRKQ